MKKLTAATGVGISAIAGGLALVGSGSDAMTETTTSISTSTSVSTSTTMTSAEASGPKSTIGDYIKENGITATPMHHGHPGPVVDLPVPDGWTLLPEREDAPYGGIVFNEPANTPDNPPLSLRSSGRLTGNVDQNKIFELAPNSVMNLPGFQALDEPHKDNLGGYEALEFGGTDSPDGALTTIAQKTVVIPAEDGVYILQINGTSARCRNADVDGRHQRHRREDYDHDLRLRPDALKSPTPRRSAPASAAHPYSARTARRPAGR